MEKKKSNWSIKKINIYGKNVYKRLLLLSLQSCLTLCDPIDCSRPGSPVPGILQARLLEWVAKLNGNKSNSDADC